MGKAKAAKGGLYIINIKAFRRDLLDQQDVKDQSFKRSCPSCYPVKKCFFYVKFILILIGFILTVSCGYHLGAGPVPPAKFGTVAVPIFVNESKEPNIQAVVTNAIILKMNQAGVMVVDVDQADKILEGRILNYKNRSVARTVASTVSEYRLSATISLVLKDRTGQSLYRNLSAQLREEYFASVILEQNEKAEAEAQQRGAIDFAEDQVRHMLDHITSGLGNDRL